MNICCLLIAAKLEEHGSSFKFTEEPNISDIERVNIYGRPSGYFVKCAIVVGE